MKKNECMHIVRNIESLPAIKAALAAEIARAPERIKVNNSWQYHAARLLAWLNNSMETPPPFSILRANGNKKLPFYAFSSLAIADCAGMGECEKYCYSLKAWRYPAAFFRQLQNSLLIRHKRGQIAAAVEGIPQGLTVRLFVDGDFHSTGALRFFMDLCKTRPDLAFYGYSKSWAEFLELYSEGYIWPDNYLTNASSGSRWHAQSGVARAFMALPVVRGSFEAVRVDKQHINNRAYQDKDNKGSKEYRAEVRAGLKAAGHAKPFACSGNCGNCLPAGRHACGSKDFDGITIGIGIH